MGSAQVWSELRRGAEQVPSWAYDTAIALAITVVSLLLGNDRAPQGWQGLDTWGVLLTCAVNLPLAARRRAPVVLCLIALGTWAVYITLDYWPVVNTLGPLLALYTVASLRSLRVASGCGLLLAALWNYAGTTGHESSWATVLGQSLVYASVICGFGHLARKAAHRNVELADLAEQLRRERAGAERRAVAEERVRIARELHDVVAHHMSVISVQVGLAGYVFESDPATARAALGTISDTSGEALTELRRLLAVLRVEDGDRLEGGNQLAEGPGGEDDFGPAPGLDQLPGLVERVRAAGVPVRFAVTGEHRTLQPGAEQCAYRVVQEALTNVLKHAHTAEAQVTVGYEPQRLTVTVTDDGRGTEQPVPPVGHGLIGMRERARIYGGRLHAGPRASGGFEVRLILPA
ncbi:sensor histidine kinase [Streptomyces iconiensis]|uniref:histidine kinase n=1 Tax=Streptomyces iconiensis TaxID=1384038 RepID=A0ABT6ZUW9_9ACTN|nr:sensor histidine kinase [Streptomyces iconiensis]MDJ1132609.1 sensor histidine kinase [Streptomyces iconiensis]